jgi:hypothetical protein
MKKNLIVIIVIVLGFVACQKEDESESPGNIKGMGFTPGNLEVKAPFVTPAGITIIGEISGLSSPSTKSGEVKSAKGLNGFYPLFGSGGLVKLKLTLLNASDVRKTVFFPKGLLWQCNTSTFQHGILLQTTWICLEPNAQRTIVVDLYCVNYGISAPDHNGTYTILGVSSSEVINRLLKLISWRKINYEMICGNSDASKGPTYEQVTEKLQEVVWNLTNNGIDISETDRAFIESLPELSPSEIPVLDKLSQFPEYFKEFVVAGN